MADSYVGKPCPKCKHVRAANEIAPDWQCPKCGVAYAKFLQSQSAPAPGPAVPRAAGAAPARASVSATASAPAESGSRGLAMFAHLSILIGFVLPFLNIIVPVVIWVMKSGKGPAGKPPADRGSWSG